MQPIYEFQSTRYHNATELAEAIVAQWLTAGGSFVAANIASVFAENTDEELADEVVSDWLMDAMMVCGHTADGVEIIMPWLETRGLDYADIAAAFARLRAQA